MSGEQSGDTVDRAYDELIERGIAHLDVNDLEGLADICGTAVQQSPDRPEAYVLLGVLSFVMDDFGRAIELLTKAHEIDPDLRESAEYLAHMHARTGNLSDSVYFAKLAGTAEPSPQLSKINVEGLNNLATAMDQTESKSYLFEAQRALAEHRFDDAIAEAEKELRLRGGSLDIFLALGEGLLGTEHLQRAVDAFRAAMHIDPQSTDAMLGLARSLVRLGEHDRALSCLDRLVSTAPVADDRIGEVAGIAAQVSSMALPAAIDALGDRLRSPEASMVTPDRDDGVRIGFLTDGARNADEMRIIESLLNGRSRSSVTAVVYSADVPGDPTPARLNNLAEGWMNIHDLDDETLVSRMIGDELDALIDLTFRAEGQRPAVLAAKPAARIYGLYGPKPGFLSAHYDGVIVNRHCLTGAANEIALDVSPLAIDSKTMPPVSGDAPFMQRGYIMFGTNLDLRYLTPDVIATMAMVLHNVPESRLMLGNRDRVPDEVRNRVLDCFSDHGVVNRVEIDEPEFGPEETLVVRRLRFMVSIDVYLETFPSCSPLTAGDALWAGAGVVAMRGRSVDGATTAEILHGAGLSEWVASNRVDYVHKATTLATACEDAEHRTRIREKTRGSSVFDIKAVADAIEQAVTATRD